MLALRTGARPGATTVADSPALACSPVARSWAAGSRGLSIWQAHSVYASWAARVRLWPERFAASTIDALGLNAAISASSALEKWKWAR